jgi:hypothetical protein
MAESNMVQQEIPWEEHCQKYCNPFLSTELLRKAVPLLDYVNWRVEEVKEGYCHSIIPVQKETTNQHKTIQSSTFFLSADYTGGIALGGLFKGLPTFGVHSVEDGYGISLWLIRAELKFKKPGTSDLKISSGVSKDKIDKIRDRFFKRKPVIERLEVTFENDGYIVSKGLMTYFAQLTTYEAWLKGSSGINLIDAD